MIVICLLLIILQYIFIHKAVRKKESKNWFITLGVEVIVLAVSIGMTFYFDRLKGKGSAPGLTYFSEVMMWMGTSILTGIIVLISLGISCICIAKQRKHR